MVRRLAALSTALLLLRLNYVAVDLTCGQHEAPVAATSEHTSGHHHDVPTLVSESDSRGNPSESCDVPVRSDCCQALASCSVTIGPSVVTSDDTAPSERTALLALGVADPSSRREAPDPPPPKA